MHFIGVSRLMEKKNKPTDFKIWLSAEQRAIIETLGRGNMTQGIKVAVDQAGHFYNCGLEPDMDLRFVGLVTTLPDNDDE